MSQDWSRKVGVDFDRANAARMYDYLLGGAHNFAVDRERADQAIAARPELVYMARANRSFLARVVRWCLQHGADQFLDLGSGVPTVGNVHEVAHALNPSARIAYVDFEPVAVTHATEILNQTGVSDTATVTRADAREPAAVLAAPTVAGLLDFDRPVALLAVALLHFVDGDIADLLGRYRAALAPGSVVAISHVSDDQPDPEIAAQMRAMRDTYAESATPCSCATTPSSPRPLPGSSSCRQDSSIPPNGLTSPTPPRPGPTAVSPWSGRARYPGSTRPSAAVAA